MDYVLPLGLSLIFLVLAGIHVYWAFWGLEGNLSAVPSIDGKPAFRPSPRATLLVAAGLALIALGTLITIVRRTRNVLRILEST